MLLINRGLFDESNILSPNIITSSIIIQEKTNTDSQNTVVEKKDKQRSKNVTSVKDGTPVLENHRK